MSRTARLPSAFTLFAKLLSLPERLAGLFRARRAEPRPATLHVEAMEERVVPDGRPVPNPIIFAGAGVGEAPAVRAYAADTGALLWATPVFEPTFTGGVRVAAGDVTGDGVPDAVVAPGPVHDPRVVVLDGLTGRPLPGALGGFLAYPATTFGGVYVAAADVNGDGGADVVTAAATPTGTRVKVFSARDAAVLSDFLVADPDFRFGATVAAADFTATGRPRWSSARRCSAGCASSIPRPARRSAVRSPTSSRSGRGTPAGCSSAPGRPGTWTATGCRTWRWAAGRGVRRG